MRPEPHARAQEVDRESDDRRAVLDGNVEWQRVACLFSRESLRRLAPSSSRARPLTALKFRSFFEKRNHL